MYLEMNGFSWYPISIHVPVQIIFDVLEEKIFVAHHIKPPYTQVQADRLEIIFVVHHTAQMKVVKHTHSQHTHVCMYT